MIRPARIFLDPEGWPLHVLAVGYAVAAYAAGLAGIFSANLLVNLLAVLLLAHAMIIAAYLVHEAGHNTIFRDNARNARLGRFMSWLCGACYGTFEDMRYAHFRHHVDNDDVVWFDYEAFLRRHPVLLRIIMALEWCYIPAHEILMHAIMVFTSFLIPARRNQRARNVTVILIRGGIFLAVALYSPKAAVLYVVAYMILLQVLRFMDSLQHDYPYHTTLFEKDYQPPHKGDSEWEQAHTFSVPFSLRFPLVNWLTLNFGYHNAHHARPIVPWYRLPALHRELYGDGGENVIPFGRQLSIFHRYRVTRILMEGGDLAGEQPEGAAFLAAAKQGHVYGGNAASFLTSF